MYLFTYKIKDVDFFAEIYHNRAEVFYRGESKTYFLFENIGEILSDYGLLNCEDKIEVI